MVKEFYIHKLQVLLDSCVICPSSDYTYTLHEY